MSDEEIGKQTPRQTFELWQMLEDWQKSFQGLTGGHSSEEVRTPKKTPVGPDGKPLIGVQGIPGLGMDQEECWAGQEGEVDWDPFSVSEQIVFDRNYALALKLCAEGQLEQEGVPRENWAVCRNWFDNKWAGNRAKFREMESAFLDADPESGRLKTIELCKQGELERYGVPRHDLNMAGEWFDAVRQRRIEREKRNAIPRQETGTTECDAARH